MSEQSQARTRREIEAHIIAQAWKDNAYKQELLNNSKAVIEKEFEVQIPDDIKVNVLEENPTTLYFVLPMRPEISGQELSDEQLEAIAGGGNTGVFSLIFASAALTSAAAGYLSISKNN
ncbi:NHLP leader peptide family RiPP precursor [Aetokthonos hydrillicola]|uniref:NHLP leader peptide family RiPP precursor n=1 Tax=Aetokthonos hydrillicola TaxID=1550245 RepID=UPI001ABB5D86